MDKLVYLDNAATSFPKPREVTEEVLRCLRDYCGNPGRGAHPLALAAAEEIYACREALAHFWGLDAPERICFTYNTTYALNLALRGILRPGEHVLLSELEHNAVRRPLFALRESKNVSFTPFPVVGLSTEEILAGIRTRIRPNTAAVVCTHSSNICSLTLPIAEIGALCRAAGLHFIVDAAQSAGHLPIDMRAMQISLLAAPAHKALYGIQGLGVLALGEGVMLDTLIQGGSGSDSLMGEMPTEPPERYEAGTLATPAIAALRRGISFLQQTGLARIHAHEQELFTLARERLEALDDITVYQPTCTGGVLLFNRKDLPSTALAQALGERGICVRAGYHCAPMAHRALGTPEGGAVRLSFGVFNTPSDLDALWAALREI